MSLVCPLMKPPRNRIINSPPNSDSKQASSFLRINKVQASHPYAQIVRFQNNIEDSLHSSSVCLVCVNLTTMNPIATNATTSRQKRVRTNPIATTQIIDLTTPASTTKTNQSPTKLAIQAFEGATASLPSSLHTLVLHFGNKLISIRSKSINKENIDKHMTKEPNYIPKSAKASDFKITLSKGASEDSKRVSFLEQQIHQAKDTYESSFKNVIEECITLKTTALQSQENDMIYTLLASIAEAINTLEGIKTDGHQKVISLNYLDCSFISYKTSKSRDSFISSYCNHHNLDTLPSPTIHQISTTHTSAAERDTELLLHTKSPELPENNGLLTFHKAIEGIIIMPSARYEKQIDENNRDIVKKKYPTKSSWEKQRSLQQWNLMLKEVQVLSNSKTSLKRNAINKTKTTVCWNKIIINYKNQLYIHNNKTRK